MSEELDSGVLLFEPYVNVGLLYAGLCWLVTATNFVAACQLGVLLPRASPESLGHNSYPNSLGCAHVLR